VVNGVGQESRIVDVTPTNIVFVVAETNTHVGLHWRFDLAVTDTFPLFTQTWHAWPIGWDVIASNQTNIVDIGQFWTIFVLPPSNAFFRIVASSNLLPVPTTAMELTVANVSTAEITDVDLQMIDASGNLTLASLHPFTTNTPYVFYLPDPVGAIRIGDGDIRGSYQQAGQQHDVFVMPNGHQRLILEINNATYSVTNK
jgi:hypothetical protein